MARHIMAVCVVCLLCADHLPCQQHIESLFPTTATADGNSKFPSLNAIVYNTNATRSKTKTTDQSLSAYVTTMDDSDNRVMRRRKRHADHGSAAAGNTPEITQVFIKRIFNEYGSGNDTIHLKDFQRMLEKLGLHKLLARELENNVNETCIRDTNLINYIKPHQSHQSDKADSQNQQHQQHHHHHPHRHGEEEQQQPHQQPQNSSHAHHNDEVWKNCSNTSDPECAASSHNNYNLSSQDIINMCPVLLYQLTADNSGCITMDILAEIDAAHNSNPEEDIVYVWIYAFVAVLACSILGLVGVAIIPFMDSRFYKHIIQFLVSLAVGTMTGDALLHLLPHSLAGQTETNMIFKGLTCMGGIVFFYITEHGLTMISEWRKNKEKNDTNAKPSRAKVMRDPDSSLNNSVAGDKLCKSKYSSYPYCYDEIAMDTKNDVWLHLPNKSTDSNVTNARNGKLEASESGENAAQSLLSTSQNNYAPIAERNHNQQHHHNHQDHQNGSQSLAQQHIPDSSTLSTDIDGNIVGDGAAINALACGNNTSNGKETMSNDTITVILREHESSHHGHSHKHGHVHSPPESLSAVAWMIIMGDGLHNFTDGMAIGAAFAENIAGGFSTALAVFCHELPHELGDFAILMKAGMSVKSAVYYNLLTGVLSFIGMIFGIVFGQSHEAAQWMFAAAAGLFIYIAMVDMMPEISAAHKSLGQFALQILGMSSGVLLMLIIAIYEGDLMNVFSTTTGAAAATGQQHVH